MTTPTPDDALELMHFGYRELVRGADALLARRGLGRVHHRILFMCRRHPGLAVVELLRILAISRQALHGPAGELEAAGLLAVERDARDRRMRRYTLTKAGLAFERELSGLQRRVFARAFDAVGKGGAAAWAEVMSVLAGGKTSARLRAATAPTPARRR